MQRRKRWRFQPLWALLAISCVAAIAWHSNGPTAIGIERFRTCEGAGFDWHGAQAATVLDESWQRSSSYHLLQAGDVLAIARLDFTNGRCELPYSDLAGDDLPLSATIPQPVAEKFERTLVRRAMVAAGGRRAYERQLAAARSLRLAPETVRAFADLGLPLPANYTVSFGEDRHA